MTLTEWLASKWLKPHKTSSQEVSQLLLKIDRDIADASINEISLDSRLAIAYNASLGCATIALKASGYNVPAGSGKHYRTIQSLRFTLEPDSDVIISFEAIGKKRAIVNYDTAGIVTEAEVSEAIKLAVEMRDLLTSWLGKNFPDLLSR